LKVVIYLENLHFSRQESSRKSFEGLQRDFLLLKRVRELKPEQDLTITQYRPLYFPRLAIDVDTVPPKEAKADGLLAHLVQQGKQFLAGLAQESQPALLGINPKFGNVPASRCADIMQS
jgi:hypothetical protein